MNTKFVTIAAAKALKEIDKSSFSWSHQDREDMELARQRLYVIIERYGYELVLPEYRIRKIRTSQPA